MEDDSLLDDDILVKETPPQSVVTPGTFSKNLIHRLSLSQQPRSETANNDNNDSNVCTVQQRSVSNNLCGFCERCCSTIHLTLSSRI